MTRPLPEPVLVAAAVKNVERCGMRPWGLHGLAHWWRVRHNGLLVAETMGANPRVVTLFAIFHDSHRHDDGGDPRHGPRAAAWLAQVRSGDRTAQGACDATFDTIGALADGEFAALATACELHTSAARHDDPTVAACFVADRLDLSRVGSRPDPRRMPPAPQLLDRAFIEAAIERERLGLGWPGGAEIGAVWGVTPRS
jgi:uncharacterized protein